MTAPRYLIELRPKRVGEQYISALGNVVTAAASDTSPHPVIVHDNRADVATALTALGTAYRLDWSDFDGRSLRNELDELVRHLLSPEPFDLAHWYRAEDICPVAGGWADHCTERIPLPDDHPARARGMRHYASGCLHLVPTPEPTPPPR